MDSHRRELARKARRASALARPEFRKASDPVTTHVSIGPTSPIVRELEPGLREKIDAALARVHIRKGKP